LNGYIEKSFDLLRRYKLEPTDIITILRAVECRSTISYLNKDLKEKTKEELLLSMRRDMMLADICLDFSLRNLDNETFGSDYDLRARLIPS